MIIHNYTLKQAKTSKYALGNMQNTIMNLDFLNPEWDISLNQIYLFEQICFIFLYKNEDNYIMLKFVCNFQFLLIRSI